MPRPRLWYSTCGAYYALRAPGEDMARYDVIEVHGPGVWLSGRYRAQGWKDTDSRYVFAEFPQLITSWSNEGWPRRDGRWVQAFTIGFADVRQDIPIVRWTGNILLRSYTATFLREWAVTQAHYAAVLALVQAAENAPGPQRKGKHEHLSLRPL